MKSAHFLLTLAIFTLASSIASAYDPSPLQDFCVAVDEPHKACMYTFFFTLPASTTLLYNFHL